MISYSALHLGNERLKFRSQAITKTTLAFTILSRLNLCFRSMIATSSINFLIQSLQQFLQCHNLNIQLFTPMMNTIEVLFSLFLNAVYQIFQALDFILHRFEVIANVDEH